MKGWVARTSRITHWTRSFGLPVNKSKASCWISSSNATSRLFPACGSMLPWIASRIALFSFRISFNSFAAVLSNFDFWGSPSPNPIAAWNFPEKTKTDSKNVPFTAFFSWESKPSPISWDKLRLPVVFILQVAFIPFKACLIIALGFPTTTPSFVSSPNKTRSRPLNIPIRFRTSLHLSSRSSFVPYFPGFEINPVRNAADLEASAIRPALIGIIAVFPDFESTTVTAVAVANLYSRPQPCSPAAT